MYEFAVLQCAIVCKETFLKLYEGCIMKSNMTIIPTVSLNRIELTVILSTNSPLRLYNLSLDVAQFG